MYATIGACLVVCLVAPWTSAAEPRLTLVRPVSGKTFQVDDSSRLVLDEGVESILSFEGVLTPKDLIFFTQSDKICDNTKFPQAGLELDFGLNQNGTAAKTAAAVGSAADNDLATRGTIRVTLAKQKLHGKNVPIFICLNDEHQGNGRWNDPSFVTLVVEEEVPVSELPIALRFGIIVVLLFLSGLFSGLNLGLMGLDVSELEVYATSGDAKQKKYAKKIMPFRKRGNFLLCTILIGNVLVNSVAVILLDAEFPGIGAIIASTAAIVIFGEITPQSVCSRHGLMIGAKTIPIVVFFMILTSPVSFPISLVLDYFLGDEVGQVYQKTQLLEMVKQAGAEAAADLNNEDLNIVAGALTYAEKTVQQVMTPLSDVFSLPMNAVLDFETMTRVVESGHSRIPVTEQVGMRFEVKAVVFVKDMAFVDPDEAMPLSQIIDFYNHEVLEVFHDIRLDDMLKRFKEKRTHLASVLKVKGNKPGSDPEYELIGIVTLEDVIEEIIGSEIQDETDRVTDNQTREPLQPMFKTPKESAFEFPEMYKGAGNGNSGWEQQGSAFDRRKSISHKVTDHVTMAAFTYLADRVDSFKEDRISKSVLKELLTAQSPSCIKIIDKGAPLSERQIYNLETRTSDYTLVLEGKLSIAVGQEEFKFPANAWYPMCEDALHREEYVTDFAAVADEDCRTVLFRVSRAEYRNALTQTRAERRTQSSGVRDRAVSNASREDRPWTPIANRAGKNEKKPAALRGKDAKGTAAPGSPSRTEPPNRLASNHTQSNENLSHAQDPDDAAGAGINRNRTVSESLPERSLQNSATSASDSAAGTNASYIESHTGATTAEGGDTGALTVVAGQSDAKGAVTDTTQV